MDPSSSAKPWTWAKVVSILEHSWIPVVVIGTGGTAGMIRRLRANLLDELQKQYVVTARAKGLPPCKVLRQVPAAHGAELLHLRHRQPAAGASSPGAEITAVVLSLPTTGPMLLAALKSQDMYLAGSFLMFLAFLIVVGVLISDLALVALDPRIRLQGGVAR